MRGRVLSKGARAQWRKLEGAIETVARFEVPDDDQEDEEEKDLDRVRPKRLAGQQNRKSVYGIGTTLKLNDLVMGLMEVTKFTDNKGERIKQGHLQRLIH